MQALADTTPGEHDRAAVERQVVGIVAGLVGELGSSSRREVTLADSLDRDLGLGSLERVELLLRVGQGLDVHLADEVVASADTVDDLVGAVLAGGPRIVEQPPVVVEPMPGGLAAPSTAATLVEALAWQVERDAERVHVFLRGDDGTEQPITYGALWRRAHAVAALLIEAGLAPGEQAALMLRTEEGFFASFFGVLLAGGVPVPIYPPFRLDRLEEYAQRQAAILRNAEARLLVTFDAAARVAGLLRSRVPTLRGVMTLGTRVAASEVRAVAATSGDPALIQYTSGSTGQPKGVLLSHANLLANIRGIGNALALRPDDVGVSWLPLYHDMGLIGTWLTALFFGLPIALLSPIAFLARPSRWLWTLHAHRGTVSPAPNFAYELCARRIPEAEIAGLDLSSWRLALNGSEAVSPATIERFAQRFAPYGFRARSMCPVYGLAEASVALTVPPLEREPLLDRVSRATFQTAHRAVPAASGEALPLCFVSCGRALAQHDVRIVDADERPLGERLEGRVEFRGPSVTSGYYRQPELTRAVVHDGWMDSGDLGYLADGELFITGRQKDLIIKGGRNLYPEEIEQAVGDVPGIRKGCVAAFSVPDPVLGTERLVVVAETRAGAPEERERLRTAIVARVVEALGIPPDTVVVTPPRAVRKTSSGKIRRGATREAYLSGTLAAPPTSYARQWIGLALRDLVARAGRAARRAGELVFALWVGTVLLVAAPLLWLAIRLVPSGAPADRLVKHACRLLLRACFCRLVVRGTEHVAGLGPAVLCANHSSSVDAVVLLAALPIRARMVAKRELLRNTLIGPILRKAGHLTVERFDVSRSVQDARAVTDALGSGASLVVFPEGTFSAGPGLLPFRLGAFKAAVEAGRPVVPVGISGTRRILGGRLPRPGTVEVVIAPPIAPHGEGWPEMVRLRDAARARVAEVTGRRLVARAGAVSSMVPSR